MLKVIKEMADETQRRRDICAKCEHNVEKKVPLSEKTYRACGLCGCVIASLTTVPGTHCKDRRW